MRGILRTSCCAAVVVVVVLGGVWVKAEARGAEFKTARILEVRDASEEGANVAGRERLPGKDPTTLVGAVVTRFRVKVALEGKSYSALYFEDKHFTRTDLLEGEEIPARVDGGKLVLKRPSDGKEVKGKIVATGAVE